MHKPRDPPSEVVIGSLRPYGLSKHHAPTAILSPKKTTTRDPQSRAARGMHDDARNNLDQAPRGRAGDRIPTRVGTSTAAAATAARGSNATVMILPQVHLRKPCYDFYFL